MSPKKENKKTSSGTSVDANSILRSIINKKFNEIYSTSKTGIVDIITFARDYLKINLDDYPFLPIILKMFYMNTPGNELLEITDEDIETIRKINNYKQPYPDEENKEEVELEEYPEGNSWLIRKAEKLKNKEIKKPFATLVMVLGRRSGKANSVDTPVLTPNGWVKMGDIKVGDFVISSDGRPTKVTEIYPQGEIDIYKMSFSDETSTECSKDHLWFTWAKDDNLSGSVKTTEQIMNSIESKKSKKSEPDKNHKIPLTQPVEFSEKEVPVDPYLVGYLLGSKRFCENLKLENKQDYEDIKSIYPDFVDVIGDKNEKQITIKRKSSSVVIYEIDKLGFNPSNKFIPKCYKLNSIQTRIDILNGLLDSYGDINRSRGKINFVTYSSTLAEDIKFIVQSLGGIITIIGKRFFDSSDNIMYYNLQIKLPSNIPPFKLDKKQSIYKKFSKYYEPKRFIESVEYIGKKKAQCITIENPSHLYLVNDFIVTHNTFTSSIILSYEVYKLLEMCVCPKCEDIKNVGEGEDCPECLAKGIKTICVKHPQAYYGVPGTEPLRVLLAATKHEQAVDPGLVMFKERVRRSPYFSDKYLPENDTVYFYSDADKEQNKRFEIQGLPPEKGSIRVKAISAKPEGAHGLGSIAVLMDEFALFNSVGNGTDRDFLEALGPQMAVYRLTHNDGRLIMISMPDRKEGKFWETYEKGKTDDNILMVQMPTWEWHPKMSREFCIEFQKSFINDGGGEENLGDITFDKLFGAQFLGNSSQLFFPENFVELAFNSIENQYKKERPTNLHFKYYMHIDCAFNSDNYAYFIGHTERRMSPLSSKYETYYIEDDSGLWTPSENKEGMFIGPDNRLVNIFEILKYIADKAKAFGVQSVSYDNIQSQESLAYFRSRGLNLRQLSFAGQNKARIYNMLRTNLLAQCVEFCGDNYQLKKELKELRVSYTRRGPDISKPRNGKDDLADAAAGCFYITNVKSVKQFPRGAMASGYNMVSGKTSTSFGSGDSLFTRFDAKRTYNG